ncbi:hypothetical protein BLNAU_20444 [Blattamonas nauphoetae]|uniref:Uncharacterized protein n=1 Tax=Blattamonas nauphoetae TaxID=2049346 RepID=A0ABQ9WYP3_9EUKA|nr:hypothetical protein BLNAU_20444 [Blattamonas nauphoetae]
MVLLPLVRTSPCLPTPPRDSSSTDTPHPDYLSPFLSVCGAGLVLSNVSLILGTGPLLDFGLLSHDSTGSDKIDLGEISTLLVGSVLRNVTSRGCCRSGLVVARGLCQKLVGTSVTLSTSHLSGTGCLDINAFGSVGCVNTSFSHCSSNAEPTSFSHQHFKQGQRFTDFTTDQITLTFTLCTFTNMTSDENGACVFVQTDFDTITMTECSFKNVKGQYGGSLYILGSTPNDGSLTLSLCSFVNSIARDYGAALYPRISALLSIDKCFFKDTQATGSASYGGCICAETITDITITNSVFMNCSADQIYGRAGALNVVKTKLEMASVQFRGNSAKEGSDVYISSGCGTPTELKTRVSNCYTNKPATSLYFSGYGIQMEIIQPFGSATKILDLELSFSGSVSEGTIEVETEHAVNGMMLLLLDNTKPKVPNSEDAPPPTCRVVVIDFQAPSTTGSSVEMSFGDSDRLQSSCLYFLIAASISATPLTLPSPTPSIFTADTPRVRKIIIQPGTIGEMLVSLEGYKLEVGEYKMDFEGSSSLSLTVSIDEDQNGKPKQKSSSVSVGPGGTDTRFASGGKYKVYKITSDEKPVMLESDGLSLIIPPFETPFVIEVKKKSGEDGECRGDDNSCGSLTAAFETARKMGLKSIELKLVTSDSLSKTVSISDKNEVIMRMGGLARPSLIVPSTFSSRPLVMLSVSNASLSLTDVDALIHFSSLDLKLVSVSSGSFEFSNGAISYEPDSTANSQFVDSNSDLCSWTTGTIEIVNSKALFKSCSLTNLSQGAIIQSGGNVTLRDVYFISNGPANKEFPSARRNVMCREDGTLSVGGLTGDGRSHLFPGSGISGDGCSVSGTTTTMSIPFLDTFHSRITHDKKTGNFEMELVGSGFLPCGLKLEVFTSLEDGNSEESLTLVVDTGTASLFTETRIELIVTPNDVANLSSKLEWKVRLLNGDRFISTQSLLLREKPRSMLWLIPVIVVVVVVFAGVVVTLLIVWRCRSKKPVEKKEEMMETADDATTTLMKDTDCDETQNESSVDQVINVSEMPTELTEENTKESCSSPEPTIEE